VLAHIQGTFATPREDLLKPLLVKLDDQRFGSRPKDLIIALQYCLLIVGEDLPQCSRHLIFH